MLASCEIRRRLRFALVFLYAYDRNVFSFSVNRFFFVKADYAGSSNFGAKSSIVVLSTVLLLDVIL